MKAWFTISVYFMLVLAAGIASASLDAQQMMERNYYVSKIGSLRSTQTMTLVSPNGGQRVRKLQSLSRLQVNGIDSKLVVRFLAPADIKGTGFLEHEHYDGDDDLWIYLPALQKSRRLVSNNKKDSFMGSDFSYGDLLPPRVELYRHTLLKSETIDGELCHVVESQPKDEASRQSAGYARKLSWLRAGSFLEARVEYYDLDGKLLKRQTVREPKLLEPERNRWVALEREMVNLQSGHRTILRFDQVEAGIALHDELFSQRTLERR